ncbi:MAG: excinuclease ABC subunit UvrC [Arenicella sp.]
MSFDAKNFLDNVGAKPGVYQMLSEDGTILYVGKAKHLQKRLSSYFRKTGLPIKTQTMVKQIADINVTVTHTENEALLLESNLIKQHKPRYNVVLRDSKSYPFIRIDDSHAFPSLSFYRGDRKQPGRYFGPYPGSSAVRETLKLLQKVLPVRQCDDVYYANRSRPCLQYQIKRCTAPCVGYISEQDYQEDIELSALFLQGKDKRLNDMLIGRMEKASKALEFEQATVYRDRINALKRVQTHQSITSGIAGSADIDVLAIANLHGKYCVEVTFIRGGRHSGSHGFFPSVNMEHTDSEVLSAFISQHYHNRPAPKEIIVSQPVESQQELADMLSEQSPHKVKVIHKIRGSKQDWMQIAKLNVEERLKRHLAEADNIQTRFNELQRIFELEEPINRIECFDISHTQGAQTVASCVVFGQAGAIKGDYRRYNINGITPGDDYAAMQQALHRRYKRVVTEEGVLPDILLIDGGKGQLNIAAEIIDELQLDSVLLVGVAKGEGRRPGLERLFVRGRKIGISLEPHSTALHLVQQIRDEAHRFAITGHRARRGKAQTQSVLQEIPGVGAKRRQTLLKHFGGIQGVQRAGIKDLSGVPGISADIAEKIYHHLKKI